MVVRHVMMVKGVVKVSEQVTLVDHMVAMLRAFMCKAHHDRYLKKPSSYQCLVMYIPQAPGGPVPLRIWVHRVHPSLSGGS